MNYKSKHLGDFTNKEVISIFQSDPRKLFFNRAVTVAKGFSFGGVEGNLELMF